MPIVNSQMIPLKVFMTDTTLTYFDYYVIINNIIK